MNAELRRNIWLEMTTHRLAAMPVIIGLVALVIYAFNPEDASEGIAVAGLVGFGILTVLWGTRLAAASITDEMANRTWDWQRLSTLRPWTMTWGKLFGATIFTWYGGALCLALFLLTVTPSITVAPYRLVLTLIVVATMLHAAAVALALHVERSRAPANRRSLGLLAVVVAYLTLQGFATSFWRRGESVTWYGQPVDGHDFMLIGAVLFAAWAILAAHRTMAQSLAVRTTPWAWLAFAVFLTVYLTGLVAPLPPSYHVLLPAVGLVVGLAMTYIMLLSEPSSPVAVRRLLWRLRDGQTRRAAEELPCWPVSWAFAVVCAAWLSVAAWSSSEYFWRDLTGAPLALVLLAARDACILLFFASAPQPKRAVGTTLIYLLILYCVLPLLFAAMKLPLVQQIVLPLGEGNALLQVLIASVQAAVAGALAVRRLRERFAAVTPNDGRIGDSGQLVVHRRAADPEA